MTALTRLLLHPLDRRVSTVADQIGDLPNLAAGDRATHRAERAAAMVAHFEAEGNDGTASYYRDQVALNVRNMAPEARNAWVDKSVALAAAQFMLAIKAAGFDSCPMEGLVPDKVRALFDLPAEATVTMAISVGEGTPEGLYGPRLRFPLADHLREH